MPDWPHAPVHRLDEAGAFIVTAGTYHKAHVFGEPDRTSFLHDSLLELAARHRWDLQAWAVFSNHYHFVGISEQPNTLPAFVRELHSRTGARVNEWDGTPGRRVWFQYWDTRLTLGTSYYARLHYVMKNPVRHGLVRVAADYPYCSAAWFEREAQPVFVKQVLSFGIERVNVPDEF